MAPSNLFLQECEVRESIESLVPLVVETGTIQFDGTKTLHAFAFPGDRSLGWVADMVPGRIERRVLAKAGFVGEDQGPVSRLGFFLRLG